MLNRLLKFLSEGCLKWRDSFIGREGVEKLQTLITENC